MRAFVNFLYEIEMLASTPRSGFAFLGSGKQSVAEHSFGVAMVAYVLAKLSKEPVDQGRLLLLCLLHDLPESRIGDLNYTQKRYVKVEMDKVLKDIQAASPLGPDVVGLIEEYEDGTTIEAQLAHDADQLELLLVLKKEEELGNPQAKAWCENAIKRLKTALAKNMAESILSGCSYEWWQQQIKL